MRLVVIIWVFMCLWGFRWSCVGEILRMGLGSGECLRESFMWMLKIGGRR